MDISKRIPSKLFVCLFITVISILLLSGIKWGVPADNLKRLYFTDEQDIKRHTETLEQYSLKEAWKGFGVYLSLHPEEEDRKLERSNYNPIRSYHPDEYFVIKSLSAMEPGKFNFNPRQFAVGGVYLYPVGGLIFLLSRLRLITLVSDINYYFYHPEEMAKFYIAGRAVTVLYGAGIILLAYLLLAKFTSRKWQSLAGALLLLFTPLMLLNSLYMYVDIPGLFWIMACLYATVLFMERFSFRRVFLAGIFAGLACGTKITFLVSFFIPFLGMFLLRQDLRKIIRGICLAFGGFFIAFFVTNPYFLLTFPAPLIELGQHTERVFSGAFYMKSLFYGLGIPLFLFCLTGIINASILMKKQNTYQRKATVLFMSWVLFFFLFISLFSKNFARYILPAVPPLVILGSIGWFGLYERLRPGYKKFLSAGFIFIAVWTFVYGMSYKMFFLRENIRTEAGVWIKENIPAGSSIGVTEVPWQFQMPPFDYYRYDVVVTGYDFDRAEETKPDYFILSSYQASIPPYPLKLQQERSTFWEEFRNSGLYKEKKVFQKFPQFLGFTFRTEVLPEDLIYLNPTIVVFEKGR